MSTWNASSSYAGAGGAGKTGGVLNGSIIRSEQPVEQQFRRPSVAVAASLVASQEQALLDKASEKFKKVQKEQKGFIAKMMVTVSRQLL